MYFIYIYIYISIPKCSNVWLPGNRYALLLSLSLTSGATFQWGFSSGSSRNLIIMFLFLKNIYLTQTSDKQKVHNKRKYESNVILSLLGQEDIMKYNQQYKISNTVLELHFLYPLKPQ